MQDDMPVSFAKLHIVFLQNSTLHKSKNYPWSFIIPQSSGYLYAYCFLTTGLNSELKTKTSKKLFSTPATQNLNT